MAIRVLIIPYAGDEHVFQRRDDDFHALNLDPSFLQGCLDLGAARLSIRGQVMEIDCAAPEVAIGLLRETDLFDEVSLYGALIHVVAEGAEAHRPQVKTALQEAGIEIRNMEIIAPSLEDVFLASVRDD